MLWPNYMIIKTKYPHTGKGRGLHTERQKHNKTKPVDTKLEEKSQVVGTPEQSRQLWFPQMPHMPCALAPELIPALQNQQRAHWIKDMGVSRSLLWNQSTNKLATKSQLPPRKRTALGLVRPYAFLHQEVGRRLPRLLNLAHKVLPMFREQTRLCRELKKKKRWLEAAEQRAV